MRHIRFQKIELNRFKCHDFMEFEFEPARFVTITGKNGAGKSTIFDALAWALYDVTTKGRKGDAILQKRHPKDCSVILTFQIGQDQYEIRNYRKHKEFKDEKILLQNGVPITGETRAATNQMIASLIMPPEIFLNCLLFSQYVNKSFTELPHSEQKTILDQMLGLSTYDKYYDAASKDESVARVEADAMERELDTVVRLTQRERDQVLQAEAEWELRRRELLGQIDQLKQQEQELADQVDPVLLDSLRKEEQQVRTRSDELIRIRAEMSAKLRQLRMDQGKLQALYQGKKEQAVAVIRKEGAELAQQETAKLHGIRSGLDAELATLLRKESEETAAVRSRERKRIEENQRYDLQEIDPVRKRVEELRSSFQTLTKEVQMLGEDLKKREEDLKSVRARLEEEKPRCYACGQLVQDEALRKLMKKQEELQDQIHGLQAQYDSRVEQRKRKGIEGKQLVAKLEEMEAWKKDDLEKATQQRIAEDEEIVARYSVQEKGLKEKQAKVAERIHQATVEIQRKSAARSAEETRKLDSELSLEDHQHQGWIEEADRKLLDLQNQVRRVSDELKQAGQRLLERERMEGQLQGVRRERETLVASGKREKAAFIEKLDRRKQELQELEKTEAIHRENQGRSTRRAEILKFWKVGFSDKGIRALLLDEAIPIMNERASELSLMTENLRIRFDSQKSLKSGESRNQFSVSVVQTRNLTDSREDFSGGEGRMADLICLMSLRRLLERMHGVEFNILLLDEILDALDPDNAVVVGDMLRKLSETQCVALISHTLRDYLESDENLQM